MCDSFNYQHRLHLCPDPSNIYQHCRNLCIDPVIYQSRYVACPSNCISNINLKTIERLIQNQSRVPESQYADVLGAVTIANNYITDPFIPANASSVWGTQNNMRNLSDRRVPHGMNYTNVSTRGNSVNSTITSNRPGGMAPGGKGCDVKHDSYARYLGKLKGQKMALVSKNIVVPKPKAVINNKSYGFSLVNTSRCVCL